MTTLSSGSQDPRTVLFLDLEGGFGGSSISLYNLVKHLKGSSLRPVVVLRKKGPMQSRYLELGVPHIVVPEMPSYRPGQRKHFISYLLYRLACRRASQAVRSIRRFAAKHDARLLHVNHESLGLFGIRLARALRLPWTCHIRTQLVPGPWSRWLYRRINASAQGLFFITDMVMAHFYALVGPRFAMDKASVVRNITVSPQDVDPLPELQASDSSLKVLSLSNFSVNRGVDRILDVAEVLKKRNAHSITFFLYGKAANTKPMSDKPDTYAENLFARVKNAGLERMVLFPGHTPEPERALRGADVLIKLTREANPWGRDIMEGMAAGLPIVTLGAYERYVEHQVNGYLKLRFDPDDVAAFLLQLLDDPGFRQDITRANKLKAAKLFDGPTLAREVEQEMTRVIDAQDTRRHTP